MPKNACVVGRRCDKQPAATPVGITFGRFQVLPHRRELLADGRPIKLGDRAFDVLMALIETRGAVIDKDRRSRRAIFSESPHCAASSAPTVRRSSKFGAGEVFGRHSGPCGVDIDAFSYSMR
jgi:hypothetical protein